MANRFPKLVAASVKVPKVFLSSLVVLLWSLLDWGFLHLMSEPHHVLEGVTLVKETDLGCNLFVL